MKEGLGLGLVHVISLNPSIHNIGMNIHEYFLELVDTTLFKEYV
jgi:hypothetical protein